MTIATNLNISVAEGERVYNAYLKAFPDISKYLEKVRKEAKRRGYILISPITGRKFWCKNFKELKEADDYKALNKFGKLGCNFPNLFGAYNSDII